jgi:orotate phosphoribosyltransferase
MMTDDEILAEFRAADALLEGHFILSSGLRSPRYLQCAQVLMDWAGRKAGPGSSPRSFRGGPPAG